ncbi:lytic murein transglycosylase [Thermomonospora umbrina]|uniref:Transglycosylase protein with SLT domain n=1 Tax=Thermomonospora umbrina TaxID=111806 RepID=A0A3D9SXE4_9ACTN|nr:lytic murein transglycosylase [Thermomonospora umbrina]REF00630.1 transglycosylase protein with SLT domain [Thermomonospora umbrina]
MTPTTTRRLRPHPAHRDHHRPPDHGAAGALALVAAVAVLALLALLVTPILFIGQPAAACGAPSRQPPAGKTAGTEIPADYLRLYQAAGRTYALPWNIVAAIGKVETDHGRSTLPGVHSGENSAGAGGPMQFLRATWKAFGVDGDKDGRTDRYDPADAIPSAARYLTHHGAPRSMRKAIWHYNHDWDYVALVLGHARRYAGGHFTVGPDNDDGSGACPAGTGPLPPGLVGKIIAFAMAQRGKRYVLGANGPDAWDCSSLIEAAYKSVGIVIPPTTFTQWPFGVKIPKGTEQPGDLVFFNSGPWTGPDRPGHVGMVINAARAEMIVARCSSCQPNIGVQNYKIRSDWVGSTRPLARPEIQRRLPELTTD